MIIGKEQLQKRIPGERYEQLKYMNSLMHIAKDDEVFKGYYHFIKYLYFHKG